MSVPVSSNPAADRSSEPRQRALADLLSGAADSFMLLRRPSTRRGSCEVFLGSDQSFASLSGLEPDRGEKIVAVVPFNQVATRGFSVVDDGAALRGIRVRRSAVIAERDLRSASSQRTEVRMEGFDLDDREYEELVAELQEDEIGAGNGCNFVLSRALRGTVSGTRVRDVIALFCRLLERERGSYWTFAISLPGLLLIGASPERHLSVDDGLVQMTPISGTLAVPPGGITPTVLEAFLADEKEVDELSMVLDEELKMMNAICGDGVRVDGPAVREMSQVMHTEYHLQGRTELPLTAALQRSLFAPTVTGSPVRSACRVIARREPAGRGYYAGVVALLQGPSAGRAAQLDSAITIRTAVVDAAGSMSLRVGATIVRHSDPRSEAAETRAKAAGIVQALAGETPLRQDPVGRPPRWRTAAHSRLEARNWSLSGWWFGGGPPVARELVGVRVLLIDCEDDFTVMLAAMLRAAGAEATIRTESQELDAFGYDLVLLGPGPGDPTEVDDPKIARMRRVVKQCFEDSIPLAAVCLGHQVLCTYLNLEVRRRESPNQGTQIAVPWGGRREVCGFYNSFSARSPSDHLISRAVSGRVNIGRLPGSDEVYSLNGRGFASVQFHPESVLTRNGPRLLSELCRHALGDNAIPQPRTIQEAI